MPSPSRAANRRGIAAMSLGMASFIANDALVKFVSQSLPAAQLIFLRGLMATLLLLAVRFTTSAPSALPAISNEARVRVLFS